VFQIRNLGCVRYDPGRVKAKLGNGTVNLFLAQPCNDKFSALTGQTLSNNEPEP
jgi:hypothetical protein